MSAKVNSAPAPLQAVKSKAISHVGYDPITRELHVQFHRNDQPHIYHDVDAETHQALLSAQSIGAHFVKHVRTAHKFTAPITAPGKAK